MHHVSTVLAFARNDVLIQGPRVQPVVKKPFFVHASCAAGVKKQERFTVLTKEQLFFSKLFDDGSSQGDFTITTEDEIRNAFELFDADQSGSVSVCLRVCVFVCARVFLLRVLTFAIP